MTSKMIITITKGWGESSVTTVRIAGNASEWLESQAKKYYDKASSILDSDDVYTGSESTHYYQNQLEKFLDQFKGLKNVEIEKVGA